MDILNNEIVKTRKNHRCNACGRVVLKGSKMHVQTNVMDGINTWRTCVTCNELLTKHSHLFEDDGICYVDCVDNALNVGQTPEMLLMELNESKL